MIKRCYNGIRYLDGLGPSLRNVEKMDLGALAMIHRMTEVGMMVDIDHFIKMEKVLRDDMDAITEKVRSETGYYINLGSGDQVSDLLFKKMGLKQIRPKMTDSGARESVAWEVLVGIQHQHPVVSDCIEFKEVEKLHGTYAKPIPRLAKRDSMGYFRLHPNFGTTRIPSSRYNCKEPNLLAMPNKTKRAKELCKGFISRPGWIYLSVDLSQIEPRTVAHRSQDPELIRVYQNNEDVYSDLAIKAFMLPDNRFKCPAPAKPCPNKDEHKNGWHYPGVHPLEHRFPSKTCFLAWLYEVTGAGLAEQMPVICANCGVESRKHAQTNCSRFLSKWNEDTCQDLINKTSMSYEGVMRMHRRDHIRGKKHGLVWDDWGRIMHCAAVRSVHPWVVSSALRELANFPIQSTAIGFLKIPMAVIEDSFTEAKLFGDIYNPLLPPHDELLGECREDMAEEIGQYIKEVFENVVELSIPLRAEMATAPNWGSMVK